MDESWQQDDRRVLSVSEVTARIKAVLEIEFPSIWVEGEISDLTRPRSGHLYFTLKDANAQLRAVIWRSTAARLPFDIEHGMQVICGGQINVYPPRGSYQLNVRKVEPQGVGGLQLALRQLQQRLAAEGLFDPAQKQPLPPFPRRIAVVTSPTGAAIRDFLEVLRGRWQGTDVLILPARVQGEGAAAEIARGITVANRLSPPPDVLVVGRGGGSLEDLWCFNEEAVVRAISNSRIPVVSAVGHEIDVTLSDLAADVRALTPTHAGQIVVPSGEELRRNLAQLGQRMTMSLRSRATAARSGLQGLTERRVIRRPFERIHELQRQLDELELRSGRAVRLRHRRAVDQMAALAGRLETLSPLAVLSRGYSVTQRLEDGRIVRDADTLRPDDLIRTRFERGAVASRVEKILDDSHEQE